MSTATSTAIRKKSRTVCSTVIRVMSARVSDAAASTKDSAPGKDEKSAVSLSQPKARSRNSMVTSATTTTPAIWMAKDSGHRASCSITAGVTPDPAWTPRMKKVMSRSQFGSEGLKPHSTLANVASMEPSNHAAGIPARCATAPPAAPNSRVKGSRAASGILDVTRPAAPNGRCARLPPPLRPAVC